MIPNGVKSIGEKAVPELSERMQLDETMMTLQLVSEVKDQEHKHDVGENVGDVIWNKLTERQKLIIKELNKSPTISAKAMSERMSVSPRTIEREPVEVDNNGCCYHLPSLLRDIFAEIARKMRSQGL